MMPILPFPSSTGPSPSQLEFDGEKCLRRRLRGFQCTKCSAVCHRNAIMVNEEGGIVLDQLTCSGCGGCVAACPGEAFSLATMDLDQAVDEAETHGVLVLSCIKHPLTAANSLHCPCLAALSPELGAALVLQNRQKVYVNISSCTGCCNQPATVPFLQRLELLQHQLAESSISSVVVVRTPDQLPSVPTPSRRSFLKDIQRNIFRLVRNRYIPPQPVIPVKPGHRRRIPRRLTIIRRTLQSLPVTAIEPVLAFLQPQLRIGSSCRPCPRCAGICPTGALSRDRTSPSQQPIFTPKNCSGCGLCVAFCKEQAIRLTPAPIQLA